MRKVADFFRRLKINDNMLLYKLVLSLLLPSMAILIIISAFFTINYSNQSMKDIVSNSYIMLSNIIKPLDFVVESAKQTTFQIYKSPSIFSLISQKYSNDDKLEVFTYLRNILAANSDINSVYIVKDGKSLIRTGGSALYEESDASIEALFQNNAVLNAVPRIITSNNGTLKLISIFYTDVNLRKDNYFVLMNISLNKNSFSQNLFLQEDQKLLVTDRKGNVLAHSDSSLFAQNMADEEFFRACDLTQKNGTTSVSSGKKRGIVSYVVSDNGKYFAFLLSDYNSFYATTRKTTNYIILFSLVLFILLVTLSAYISYKIYSPINSIFTNIKGLIRNKTPDETRMGGDLWHDARTIGKVIEMLNNNEQNGSGNERNIKNNFMFRLLSGRRGMTQNEFTQGMERFLHISKMNCSFYQAIVLRIDNIRGFLDNNSAEAIDFQISYLEEISDSIYGKDRACRSFSNDSAQIVIFVGMESPGSELTPSSQEHATIQEAVQQLFNLSLTIGISSPVDSLTIESLKVMYDEAFSYTNYRVLYGLGSSYCKENVKIKAGKCEKAGELASLVITSLKSDTKEQFEENINWLFASIKAYSYESILEILIQIYHLLLKMIAELQPHNRHMEEINLESVKQNLMEYEDYDQLKQLFFEQYFKIHDLRSAIKNSKALNLVEESVAYINSHYNDPNLSASRIAEMLGITPQYFSKLFKQMTEMSFPDYLSDIRLENAKKMLVDNPLLSVSAICEKTGYNSASYFSSSFTKKYGIPPSKFVRLTNEKQEQ